MTRLPRRTSLTVLFLMVLLCAMVPLFLIYYTAHQTNDALLRSEVANSIRRHNQDFSDRLQADMTRILNTNHMLIQNWELGKLAVVPEEYTLYQKSQAFQNIQDKLSLAQLSSQFIQDIDVYFPAQDKCVSANATTRKTQEMRTLTAQLDTLPRDQFFIHNGDMVLISENTFSPDTEQPNLVIRTTLSRRELLRFYEDMYWNELSGGTIMSLHSMDWPRQIDPSSPEAFFYQQIARQVNLGQQKAQEESLLVSYEGAQYQLLYNYIPYADLILLRYFNVDSVRSPFGSTSMLFLFAAVMALTFLLIYYALFRLVSRPLNTLMDAFAQVEKGNLNVKLDAEARGEFAFVFEGFSHMLERLKVLIEQMYLQGQMVKKSEFKQLQAQIDPHFLYNGFFILNKRIRSDDKEGALAFSRLLSDYFRYVTQNARDAVPLSEEVNHAYNYARIQQIRFSNRLALTLDPVPEECARLPVPRLILQPIVENVFRHVLDAAEGVTALHISYHPQRSGVEMWIEDGGTAITDEKLATMRETLLRTQDEREISGLTNVHMRLQLYYGKESGLRLDRSEMGGLRVRVRILEKKEQSV